MTNLDSILKSRDITLPAKVHLVKAMVFPVVMYGSESWTIKKVGHQRIDAFELCCWRRLLKFPWAARRSNQFILKEISPEYSLGGLTLKLKLQYFGHLMWRTNSLEKTLKGFPNGSDGKESACSAGKDPDYAKDWKKEEKGPTEDEMVRWHHQCKRHEFE